MFAADGDQPSKLDGSAAALLSSGSSNSAPLAGIKSLTSRVSAASDGFQAIIAVQPRRAQLQRRLAQEPPTTGAAARENWTMMTVMLSRPAPLSACRLGAMHVSHSSAATVGSDLPDSSPMRTMLTACTPAIQTIMMTASKLHSAG